MSIVSPDLPVSSVVALTAVLTSADNGMGVSLALKDLSAVNVRRLIALCTTGLCMVPVGLLALRKLDQASIQLVVGVGLLAFALWRLSALVVHLWAPPCLRLARRQDAACSTRTAAQCTHVWGCGAPASQGRRAVPAQNTPSSPGGRSAGASSGDTAIAAVGRVALGMETPSVGPYGGGSSCAEGSPLAAGAAAQGWGALSEGGGDVAALGGRGQPQASPHTCPLTQDSDDPEHSVGGRSASLASSTGDTTQLPGVLGSSPPMDTLATGGEGLEGGSSALDIMSGEAATALVQSSPRHREASAPPACDMPALQLPAPQGGVPVSSTSAHALDPVDDTWQDAPVEDSVLHGHAARPGWVCFSVTACDRTIPVCGLPVFSCAELLGEFKRLRWDADARWETYVLLLCGLVAGVAGGSIGINGPPIVVAFTVLKARLSKDDMRSISVSYFFLELMLVRLPLLVSSGLLNVAPGTAAGILGAALVGLSTGSAFRSYVDTEKIILVLVLLVFASAWLMTLSAVGPAAAPPVQVAAIATSALLLVVLGTGAWGYSWAKKAGAHGKSPAADSTEEPKKAPATLQDHVPTATAPPLHPSGGGGGGTVALGVGPLDPPQSFRSTTV